MTGSSENPLPEGAEAAWAALQLVSRSLLAGVERDLKEHGLPPLAWYDVLLELHRAGDAGLRPFELQDRLLLAQYNLSRLLDRMARDGLVERVPAPEDGRGQVVRISKSGQAARKKIWPVYREAIGRRFADRLSDADSAALLRILQKLR